MSATADETVMSLWSVYEKPSDYPNDYVARRWEIRDDGHFPTNDVIVAPVLDGIESYLERLGLVKLMRSPEDDPVILSTWL